MATPTVSEDDYDDGYGPPTREDDAWFQHHVVSKGYPKLHKSKPLEGQTSFDAFLLGCVEDVVNGTDDN